MDPKEKTKWNERIIRLKKGVKDWYAAEMALSKVEAAEIKEIVQSP